MKNSNGTMTRMIAHIPSAWFRALEQLAIEQSIAERKPVTRAELVRRALEKAYPLPKR